VQYRPSAVRKLCFAAFGSPNEAKHHLHLRLQRPPSPQLAFAASQLLVTSTVKGFLPNG
jgi:hypothetical protein